MINIPQARCLVVLADLGSEGFWHFLPVQERTGYNRQIVRRHVRALARKGYAKFAKGLWNEEGPAGAGYAITKEGLNLIEKEPVIAREARRLNELTVS